MTHLDKSSTTASSSVPLDTNSLGVADSKPANEPKVWNNFNLRCDAAEIAVRETLGQEALEVETLSGGIVSKTFRVITKTDSLVLKFVGGWDGDYGLHIHGRECAGLELARNGGVYVPEVILKPTLLREVVGSSSMDAPDEAFIILEDLRGKPASMLTDERERFDTWEDIGNSLRVLHQVSMASFGSQFDPATMSWGSGSWQERVEKAFSNIQFEGLYREGGALRDAANVQKLVDVLRSLHALSPSAHLVHRDIHLENAIKNDRGVGIIDFGLAQPDLAPWGEFSTLTEIEVGVLHHRPRANGLQDREALLRGYGMSESDYDHNEVLKHKILNAMLIMPCYFQDTEMLAQTANRDFADALNRVEI